MKPEDQANNYNEIAEFWSNSNFNDENGIAQHRKALQFTKTSGSAIDIGCGSSGRILNLMIQHGLEAEGLDFSIEMLKLARIKNPSLVFHHADICEWKFSKKYEFISAWDSIWHIPLEYQETVLRKLCDALSNGGVIIFTSGAVDEAGDSISSFLGQNLYHAALGVPALLEVLNSSSCICRHLENDDWPSSHLYIIAQKKNA